VLRTWKTAPANRFDNPRRAIGFAVSRWCTLVVMRFWSRAAFLLLLLAAGAGDSQKVAAQSPAPSTPDYSGMYSFVNEGEFVQITLEENGKVSGFISRFGDSGADKGTFLDQFLKSGKSEGASLSFMTENVHGVWFSFDGAFSRGSGKTPDDEGYYLLQGKLTRFSVDADKKTTSQERQVKLTSFPRDAGPK